MAFIAFWKRALHMYVCTHTYTYTYTLGVTSHIYAHLKYQLFLTINRLTALVILCSGCRALVRRTILAILILKALALSFLSDRRGLQPGSRSHPRRNVQLQFFHQRAHRRLPVLDAMGKSGVLFVMQHSVQRKKKN